MGKRKRRFTLNEHQEMGERLSGLEEDIYTLYAQFVVAYPLNGTEVRSVRRLGLDVQRLRIAMNNALFTERPGDAQISTYYPPQ